MPTSLESRLSAALAGSPLLARIANAAAPLVERRSADACSTALDGAPLRGLARAIAASPESARYLSLRPQLFARVAVLEPGALERRAAELAHVDLPDAASSREDFLDGLRLLRRDEMLFAACAQLSGLASFDDVSRFLSLLAETCAERALRAAETKSESQPLTVLGMGKLAGREFTYHSDLDVIFLFGGDAGADAFPPSRIAQRWISTLATMTGAGYAYHVDSRLRPSGQQGALVTTFEAFARYQTQQAETWEHVALLRARAVAGDRARTQAALEEVRDRIVREAPNPWKYLADMRGRVVAERGVEDEKTAALKTGRGGIMDVEFLGAGALLERGMQLGGDSLPAIPAMLRAAVQGPTLETLLLDYAFLRRVEACARWIAGRPVESIARGGETFDWLADLVSPGQGAERATARIELARARIAECFDRVAAKESIEALAP
jgi:[glutamine synthetase] adenylyltransferase / [glutamine synthetase]-adenylyl-L-tyrosine phosphorylase